MDDATRIREILERAGYLKLVMVQREIARTLSESAVSDGVSLDTEPWVAGYVCGHRSVLRAALDEIAGLLYGAGEREGVEKAYAWLGDQVVAS